MPLIITVAIVVALCVVAKLAEQECVHDLDQADAQKYQRALERLDRDE